MKKRLLALLLTTTLALSSTIVSYAAVYGDGKTHDVTGGDETIAADGKNTVVNVEGDINTDSDYGVQASGEGAVNVNGNVTSQGEAAVANSNGTINVTGDVSAKVVSIAAGDSYPGGEGGTVTVTGNASGNIHSTDGTVSVTGNVTGSKEEDATIQEAGDSKITIDGDVTAPKTGIKTDGDSTIIITGTLTTSGSEPVILLDHSEYDGDQFTNKVDAGASTIIVYEIKGNTDNLVKSGYSSGGMVSGEYVPITFKEDTNASLKNSQAANIFYIIKKAEGSDANISSLSGTTKKEGYDTATEGTVITVTVKEGYGLSAGQIEVTKNADGSYTLTVPAGGGVTLTTEVIEEAVENVEEAEKADESDKSSSDEKKDENIGIILIDRRSSDSSSSEASVANNGASAQAVAVPVGTVVKASLDPVSMGDAAYVAKVVELIAGAPYGGVIELSVTDAVFLDNVIVSALETRSDVSVKITVTINGVPVVINIPAGFNLRALMGADGRIDLQKLVAALGTAAN